MHKNNEEDEDPVEYEEFACVKWCDECNDFTFYFKDVCHKITNCSFCGNPFMYCECSDNDFCEWDD